MATPVPVRPTHQIIEGSIPNEALSSGISWGAVIAGAFAVAALSLILLALGTGMGLSAMSPWANGAPAAAVGIGAIVWLIVIQIIASAIGGYLAGRLRTKWVNLHTHEVYFRDTAHGFLAWAVALVITAGFLTAAVASTVGSGTSLAARATTPTESTEIYSPNQYFADSLFRTVHPTDANDASVRNEANLILANALRQRGLSTQDRSFLAELVAARTGLNETDADQRVSQVFSEDRQAADTTRKALAHSLYWMFIALLIGAFCASYAATIGGRQRDHVAL